MHPFVSVSLLSTFARSLNNKKQLSGLRLAVIPIYDTEFGQLRKNTLPPQSNIWNSSQMQSLPSKISVVDRCSYDQYLKTIFYRRTDDGSAYNQLGIGGVCESRTQNVRRSFCTERACNGFKMPPAIPEYIMRNHDSCSRRKNCKAIGGECATISEMPALWGCTTCLGGSKLSAFAVKGCGKLPNI
jgi:hypothetical protein